jgi:selenocysteine lyase/cysteine desulfurase
MIDVERYIAPAIGSDDLYLANASAGLMSAPVLDAVIGHLRREAEVGAGQAAIEARGRLEAGYAAAARLIGADPDEVAILDSGNRGMQQLIQSVPLVPGDHVLVDRTCWCATLDMLRKVKGIVVDVMATDHCGRADVEATRANLHPATRLVILTWCPATAGTVNPAEEIGALAASIGAWYFVDACQMLGQRPVDVRALGCHGLTASGRKWLRGPRGTSLLFASRAFLNGTEAYMPDQVGAPRSDARRYEQGEGYIAGRIGFGVAVEGALEIGLSRIHDHLSGITSAIRARLAQVPGVELVGQDGEDLSALVTFTLAERSSIDVGDLLAARGIVINTPLASYSPYDMAARGLTAVVRVAPQMFTSTSDVDRLVEAVAEIALASQEG